MIRVVDQRFNPGAELDAFCVGRFSTGAVASFIGLARGEPDGGTALELEAYAGFTEAAMADMAAEATRRFGLQDVRIVHRVGAIAAGEAIVLVLTAAAHRRAAFEACDYLMDHLKSRAPLWKKEHGEGETRWVEPTDADRVDLARWERDGGTK
jgi:molybdopterin synthase catalytic subunit